MLAICNEKTAPSEVDKLIKYSQSLVAWNTFWLAINSYHKGVCQIDWYSIYVFDVAYISASGCFYSSVSSDNSWSTVLVRVIWIRQGTSLFRMVVCDTQYGGLKQLGGSWSDQRVLLCVPSQDTKASYARGVVFYAATNNDKIQWTQRWLTANQTVLEMAFWSENTNRNIMWMA